MQGYPLVPTKQSRQSREERAERKVIVLPEERRESLTQLGGPIEQYGEEPWASELVAALAASDTDETQDLTHGFHTYPARMHPRLAREIIGRWSEPGDIVLDPFCGSGTVLVEALVAGCKPQGVDLNPIALRISEVHCALQSPETRRRFQRVVKHIALASEERVRGRARAHIAIDRETQELYLPHVLFELCGLRDEIESVPHEGDRRALQLVFSALLVKFSRLRADTSVELVDKRIRKGLVTEFFARKADELVQRWEALHDAAPQPAFEARLLGGDARELPALLGSDFGARLILCSPPYGGTYDYAKQHALRNAWFGFDTERFEEREIGSRRALSKSPRALERWDEELLSVLRSMRNVLHEDGRIVLWLGDAELITQRVPGDEQVARLAPAARLKLVAAAAQWRPDPRGGSPRAERLLLLEPLPV